MNREELRRYVGVTGHVLGHVEKDYFQHIILGALSRKMGGLLVFKGGTSLQKTGLIPRFSEDLDFTITGHISVKKLEKNVTKVLESYNYPAELDNHIDNERTMGFRIKIQGPLFRNRKGICTIRIEASRREEVILTPTNAEIDPLYSDILPYVLEVMDLEEIAAEKVRAIYTRNKARDLYDLHKILETGAQIRQKLVRRKMEYYNIAFNWMAFIERCTSLTKRWKQELDSLMEYVPPKERALEVIKKAAPQ